MYTLELKDPWETGVWLPCMYFTTLEKAIEYGRTHNGLRVYDYNLKRWIEI